MTIENTYWNHKGLYQALSKKLEGLIPTEGAVANPRKNKALEKFRKACNCYHDLYNNGLYNRKSEFRAVFGFSSSSYKIYRSYKGNKYAAFANMLYINTEEAMDEIVMNAAKEQGLI